MKNVILASFLALIVTVTIEASDVLPGSTLKLNSADRLTDISKVTVELEIKCKYQTGIFYHTSKSCGYKKSEIAVESDGTVKVPAIQKFSGLHAQKSDNYELSLTISENKEWLVSVDAFGDKLSKFNFTGKTLSIYRLNGASIAVSYHGADFFGSSYTQEKNATMFLSFESSIKRDIHDLLIVSNLTGTSLWFKENYASYAGKELLRDVKEIKLENLVYASFAIPSSEKLEISLYYFQAETSGHKNELGAKLELELKHDVLENLGSIELK